MMDPRTVHRLLDVEEAARLLTSLPSAAGVDAVSIESIWAKPGRHFNVCYRLGDSGRLASLCVVNAAEAERGARRMERWNRASRAEAPAAALVAGDVLAQSFPFDYRLEQLSECLRPGAVHEALGNGDVDECEVVAYRAGMRCQIRYSAGGTARAYGKIAVERDPGRRRRVHREIGEATAATALRLPALVGSVEALGLDLVAAVDGRSLHDALAAAPAAREVERAAAALAELHWRAPAPADRVHSADDELALVRSWTQWMSVLEPALEDRLDRALARLAATVPVGTPATFAHRDFHDKQVLLADSHLWLLDIDTACTGDRELDLGNFLAHLFLRGLQWDRAAAHRELEGSAERAYGNGARRDATGWYRRASLVRLACVYRLRPQWSRLAPLLLEEALAS